MTIKQSKRRYFLTLTICNVHVIFYSLGTWRKIKKTCAKQLLTTDGVHFLLLKQLHQLQLNLHNSCKIVKNSLSLSMECISTDEVHRKRPQVTSARLQGSLRKLLFASWYKKGEFDIWSIVT